MSPRRALVAIHVAAVLFGLTGVFGHAIQAAPEVITLGRAAFAVLALVLVARWQAASLTRGLTLRRLAALLGSGGLLAVHWVTFFLAVKLGGVAVATLGFASVPAFTVLLERMIFGDRIQKTELGLLGLVTVGLILVAPTFDLRDAATEGLAWGVLSGFSFALLAIVNRWAARGLQALQVACWQNVAVVLLMLPFATGAMADVTNVDWVWLALLGIFCTGLSHWLFVSSLAQLNARTAGMVIALEPVYAIAFAWALFGETPGARMLLGAACILCASVLTTLRQRTPGHA